MRGRGNDHLQHVGVKLRRIATLKDVVVVVLGIVRVCAVEGLGDGGCRDSLCNLKDFDGVKGCRDSMCNLQLVW